MQSALDRRQAMLELLSDRRQETVANLMSEFGVSRCTVLRDIETLSCSAPIFTVQGNGGGVRVADGYYYGRRYLHSDQEALLRKLMPGLQPDEQKTIQSIIPAEKWEIVQLELKRRDNYRIKHGLRTLGRYTDEQPFSNKVFCGVCGALFWRRTWYRLAGEVKIWHCTDRYDKDDRPGCPSLIIKEKDLHRAFVEAWNRIRDTRDERLPVWQKQKDTGTPLVAFYAERFIQLSAGEPMKEIDLSIVTKTLEHVVVSKNGSYTFYLLDGSKETVDLQK